MRYFCLVLIVLFFIAVTGSSCALASGCPAEKAQRVKFDRKGGVKYKQGKTSLFPKNVKK